MVILSNIAALILFSYALITYLQFDLKNGAVGGDNRVDKKSNKLCAIHPLIKIFEIKISPLVFKSERPHEIRVLLQLLGHSPFNFPGIMNTFCPAIFTLLSKFMVTA